MVISQEQQGQIERLKEALRAANAAKLPRKATAELRSARAVLMHELYSEGASLRDVGAVFGITGERARKLVRPFLRDPPPLSDDDAALVRDINAKLRGQNRRSGAGSGTTAVRALRDALILKFHANGHTLQEIGDRFVITRERARQIIKRLTGGGHLRRPHLRLRSSPNSRRAAAEKGRSQRLSGERVKNPERNLEILRLVNEGLTYSEVARAIGVSRSVVCTVVYRANHRAD